MCTLDLLNAIGAAQDEYVQEACYQKAKHSIRNVRFYLIAALIAILLLLAGCAVWIYRMEHLVLIDHTAQVIITASEPESELEPKEATPSVSSERKEHPGPYVAQQVLSMQGYEGSPSYNAVQEWLAYETDYVILHPECRFQDDFHRPDAYQIYACYTQEMVDKVDELCEKYGLHLMGKGSFLNNESEMKEHGLTYILSPEAITRCFYGHLFEDGSFTAEGELVLSGDYERIVQFQMHNIKKDAFFPVTLGLNGLNKYTQWNYRTKEGFQALMALSDATGFIITENEDRFITVIVEDVPDVTMVWHGLPSEKGFLESVCNCFVFSES